MSFLRTLFVLIIFPLLFAAFFPGNTVAQRSIKHLLNNYPYHILVSEKTRINTVLVRLFGKTKNNRRPFIHYARIGYLVLAVLQIPISIIVHYRKIDIFVSYFWALMVICLIPNLLLFIIVCILEHKEKAYNKQMGIETKNFWNLLKADQEFKALEAQMDYEKSIRNAIAPYVRIKNPKKRKVTIAADDLEKVNAVLKKDFPRAHTELTIDEKGNKVFWVYCKGNEDRNIVLKAYIKKNR